MIPKISNKNIFLIFLQSSILSTSAQSNQNRNTYKSRLLANRPQKTSRALNFCDSKPCKNGGICSANTERYNCMCLRGYQGDNCEVDIDECASWLWEGLYFHCDASYIFLMMIRKIT